MNFSFWNARTFRFADYKSKDAEYPYKNTYHNDGFTIIEKEDKTHITFLKGKQRFTVVFRANKEKPIEHILEPE